MILSTRRFVLPLALENRKADFTIAPLLSVPPLHPPRFARISQ
jgi:hypothetical protein